MNKERMRKKFMEISRTQLRMNIAMRCLDEMVEAMPERTAWRGWRYEGWSDEEILLFRDWVYMHGGYRSHQKNKKASTTLLPRSRSSLERKKPRN
tara:strand:- start:137 stop:421 length:285 start_codon:yes stop_codon:yes gene_type:complete